MQQPKLAETNWNKNLEKAIYEEWKKSKVYKFDSKTKKKIYSIDTPPPYVNAPVHMGHCTTYILMDMFARFKRMTGFEVLFPLGLDRNGLPIEVATEKKFNVRPGSIPREKFIEYCKKLLEEFSTKSTETFLRSGISFSSWEPGKNPGDLYFTDSDEYRKLTQSTFIDLWKRGLVYEDKRLNNYCPGCRTTVADNEVDHVDLKTFLNHVNFTVKGKEGTKQVSGPVSNKGEEKITIATTRPELLCTAGMVVYHPDDKRYQHLKGKKAIVPIYNLEIPIQPHPIAKPEYGSGIMYMSKSAGDQNAIRFLIEMKIDPESCITVEGKMDKNSGFLEGMKVEEARKTIIERLEKEGSLVKKEEIIHSTPICERSKHPIEFITMPEYYVKQIDFLDDIRKLSDKINFYSKKNKQLLLDWISSVSIDWPVSRRRVYATEIPLWYCTKCGEAIVPPKGKYYKPWKEKAPVEKCKCGSTEFEGETRVFDTWFDSSISPLYILQFVENPEFFKKAFPATLRPQGKEIVRTWLYYTLLRCYQLTGKPAFDDVWIHYHILDGQGRKMSKSLGNVVDPAMLIDKFGAESVRLWAALEGNLVDTDFMCSEDKIQGNGKFLTKLWNVARFISGFGDAPKKQPKLAVLDQWILSELNQLIGFSKEHFEEYDFHNPGVRLRHFVWEIFASHYLELVKARVYNTDGKFTKEEQESAIWTLNQVLDTLLKLLSPIVPFITYKIYKDLRGKDVHMEKFPVAEKIEFEKFTVDELVEINAAIWKAKRDKNLSLKDGLDSFDIPKKFKDVERELIGMHGIKAVKRV